MNFVAKSRQKCHITFSSGVINSSPSFTSIQSRPILYPPRIPSHSLYIQNRIRPSNDHKGSSLDLYLFFGGPSLMAFCLTPAFRRSMSLVWPPITWRNFVLLTISKRSCCALVEILVLWDLTRESFCWEIQIELILVKELLFWGWWDCFLFENFFVTIIALWSIVLFTLVKASLVYLFEE